MAKSSSPFRFVASSRRGEYSVWRGERDRLGFVTKQTFRASVPSQEISVQRTVWIPSTLNGKTLASEPTRETAARALWNERTGQGA